MPQFCLDISNEASCLFKFSGAFRKIAKSDDELCHVRIEQLGSHWTDFMQFYICVFFEKIAEKFKVLLKI
jgi:hypothetical protein